VSSMQLVCSCCGEGLMVGELKVQRNLDYVPNAKVDFFQDEEEKMLVRVEPHVCVGVRP